MSEPSTPDTSEQPAGSEPSEATAAQAKPEHLSDPDIQVGPLSDPSAEAAAAADTAAANGDDATTSDPSPKADTATTSDPAAAPISAPAVELEPDPSAPQGPSAGPPGPPPPRKPAGSAGSVVEAAFVQANLPARKWPPTVVADVMTRRIIALGENEPLGDLESGMKRFRFRHLPVVGPGFKLVGIITRSDLLHAVLGARPDGTKLETRVGPETRASEIMRRDVLTARLDSPLASAGRVMTHDKIGCLPVILEDQTLVGILTQTDFMLVALEMLEGKED